MRTMLKLTFLVLIFCAKVSFSAKILCVVSMPTFSHNLFFRPIWKALADRGHQLTVLTANPMEDPYPNIREIDMGVAYEKKKMVYTSASTPTRYNWPSMVGRYFDMFTEVAAVELAIPEVRTLLTNRTEHFDLVIAETHVTGMLGFAHRFKCPLVGISSVDVLNNVHRLLGNPTHPVQYPQLCGNLAPKRMSFEERAIEVYNEIGTRIQEYLRKDTWNEQLRTHFGADVPTADDLIRGMYFLLLNIAPLINSRPLGPKVVPIGGGSHITPPKPLEKNLQALLDTNPQGVVYFSLGTNIKESNIPYHILNTTLEAFKELPYQFIWKWGLNIPSLPGNVKVYQWLPQQDLLRHPNVKAFIFQGGIHSKEEAILAMVPMVGIPMMGDQRKNIEDLVSRGLGVLLDKDTLTKQALKEAIRHVIKDQSFKRNLQTFARLLHDSAQSGVEKAVWHVEFALRNPQGARLFGQAVRMPWYQYYFLDVFGVVLLVFLVMVALARWAVLVLIRRLFRCKVKSE